jgi:hypothetical protein
MIISDYNSYIDYRCAVNYGGPVAQPLTYQNKPWVFIPAEPTPDRPLHVHGVRLTQSGKELLSIVDIVPDDTYTAALIEFFEKQGMKMTDNIK